MFVSFQGLIAKASSGYAEIKEEPGPYDTEPKGPKPATYIRGAAWLFGTPSDQWTRIPTADGAILQPKSLRVMDDCAYSTPLSSSKETAIDILRYAFAVPASISQYSPYWASRLHTVDCSNIDTLGGKGNNRKYYFSQDGQLDVSSDNDARACFRAGAENVVKGFYRLGHFVETSKKLEPFGYTGPGGGWAHAYNNFHARWGGGRRDMLARVTSEETDRTWALAYSRVASFFATDVSSWKTPCVENSASRASYPNKKITAGEPTSIQVHHKTYLNTGCVDNPTASVERAEAAAYFNKPYFAPAYGLTGTVHEMGPVTSPAGAVFSALKTEDIGKQTVDLGKVGPAATASFTTRALSVAATKLSRITSVLVEIVTATECRQFGGPSNLLRSNWQTKWGGLLNPDKPYKMLVGVYADLAIWYSDVTYAYNRPEDTTTHMRVIFAYGSDIGPVIHASAHGMNPFTDIEWSSIGTRIGEIEAKFGASRIEFQYTDNKYGFLDSLAMLTDDGRVLPNQHGPTQVKFRDEYAQQDIAYDIAYPYGGDINLLGENTDHNSENLYTLTSSSGLCVGDTAQSGGGGALNVGWEPFTLDSAWQIALYQAWTKAALPMLYLGKVALGINYKFNQCVTLGYIGHLWEKYPRAVITPDDFEGASKGATLQMIILPSSIATPLYNSESTTHPFAIADHGRQVAYDVGLYR